MTSDPGPQRGPASAQQIEAQHKQTERELAAPPASQPTQGEPQPRERLTRVVRGGVLARHPHSRTGATVSIPTVVSFGAGVNSTALLIGLHERSKRPDAILFADTGGELAEVYKHVIEVNRWCVNVGFPEIVTVRYDSPRHKDLEHECLNNKTLPSLAFGFRGCSVKWKRQPMDRWVREWPSAIAAWNAGLTVLRLMGIHAGESHRGQVENDEEFVYDRPLIRWGWAQKECEAACLRVFGYVPRKSACFYCPAMKKHEVIQLANERPDLFQRAVAIEQNAALETVKGLGRHWTWQEVAKADAAQLKLFPESVDMPCVCE